MAIRSVYARTIYDSRGNPTVECDVRTDSGLFRAAVPSGASTGAREATELRDGDQHSWQGKGVTKAIHAVNTVLGPGVVGMVATDQKAVDAKLCRLDGTENKSRLGANSILAVSLAVSRAGAAEKSVPLYQHLGSLAGNSNFVLPVPSFNVINGGVHGGNELAQQEFMILPTGAPSFSEGLRWATEVYHTLKVIIKDKYGIDAVNVGDEGGFAPPVHTGEQALDLILHAIERAGYAGKFKVAFDSAATEFFSNGRYKLDFKSPRQDPAQELSGEELAEVYGKLMQGRPFAFVEDPFAEDDWEPARQFTAKYDIEVVGDDMLCTNPVLIKKAIETKAVNSLLLKVNQIGTVTEAIEATSLAKAAGWGVLTSHRSGETADDFIADLAVGLATGKIKSGAPARGERLAKYNQLLRIEEEMTAAGMKPKYAGEDFRFVPWHA